MSVSEWTSKLYRGESSLNIVGHRRTWYTISAVFLVLALVGLFGRGLNLGIEFRGGSEFVTPSTSCQLNTAEEAVTSAGATDVITQRVGDDRLRIQSAALEPAAALQVTNALAEACEIPAGDIKVQVVGPTWGGEITQKALTGLLVFLVAVVIFLSLYFDWRMALAALVALIHDVVMTVGIYALIGFEVTPATVIGVLTILAYSLYDTVVVFDKVKENTKNLLGQSRMTYSEAANLALNQTFIRSINTTVVAVLPVAAILFVGVGVLGAGTLKDLALALFIGLLAGTYSSLFIATPFLCQLKERQPEYKALTQRVMARRAMGNRAKTAVGADGAAAMAVAGVGAADGAEAAATTRKERPHRSSGPRNQPKRTPRSKR